jgi:hypothetical protein
MYGAYRPGDAGTTHWRLAHFIAPFWVIPPAGMLADQIMMKGYIPMDDTHTLVITIQRGNAGRTPLQYKLASGAPVPGLGQPIPTDDQYRPNSTEWFGRWRLLAEDANDYLIDREAQRNGNVFSGIFGLAIQDAAIAGTMGPITDRTFENLAPSDAMIARMRHKLVRLAEAFAKDKSLRLPGVDDPGVWRTNRAGNFIAPAGKSFRAAYEDMMRQHASAAPRWAAE